MVSTIIVIIFGIMFTGVAQFPLKSKEIVFLWLGLFVHILGTFALVWITRDYYGYGDMLSFFRLGGDAASYVMQEPSAVFELFKISLTMKGDIPFEMAERGDSTGAIVAITALLIVLLGKSLHAVSLVFSLLAFSGNYAIYLVFRRVFPDQYRTRLLIVCLLFPSAVFWTSGILKEAIAIGGLGWLFFGAFRLVNKRYLVGTFFVIFGGTLVGVSKAYILFPFALAFGAWLFWRKAMSENSTILSKPIYIVIGIAIAVGGIIGLGILFPRYAPDQIIESTMTLQSYGTAQVTSGSSYQLIDPQDRSISGQLLSAPLALVSSLFRPFFFEVHNFLSAINAFETTLLLLCFLFTFIRRKPREVLRLISTSPTLIFCLVFVLAFGTGVGLATTNLGTLSRYRIPMMPFYGALIVLLLPLWRPKKTSLS